MGCYKCGASEGNEAQLCPTCTKQRLAQRASAHETLVSRQDSNRSGLFQGLTLPILLGVPIALVAIIFFLNRMGSLTGGAGSKPTIAAIETIVRQFHTSDTECKGTYSENLFRVTGIGEYVPQFGGYPVYADFSNTCTEGRSKTTFNSSNTATNPVAVAYVRAKSMGGYEAFVPDFFIQAQKEMQHEINSAFQKMPR